MPSSFLNAFVLMSLFALGASACSDEVMAPMGQGSDPQTPPMGEAAIDAWLAEGDYLEWACEAKEHNKRGVSPHPVNRICVNDRIRDAGESGAFPEGASAVKELYDGVGGDLIGYSVSLKVQSDSDDGKGWYFYQKRDGAREVDGLGVDFCVSCHANAGSDDGPGARDFVFTQRIEN